MYGPNKADPVAVDISVMAFVSLPSVMTRL